MKLKQPTELWWLSGIYAIFNIAYGTMLAQTTLFLIHRAHIATSIAYGIFAAFVALNWALPLMGGALAERFGYKSLCTLGLTAATLGLLLLSIQTDADWSLLGIGLFAFGYACFTPSLWCLIDHLYEKKDPRRESGFTYLYLLLNLGAVLGIFVSGYLAITFSYRLAFAFNTVALIIAFCLFLLKYPSLIFHSSRSVNGKYQLAKPTLLSLLVLLGVIGAAFSYWLLSHFEWNNVLVGVLFAGGLLSLAYVAKQQSTEKARWRLLAFIALTAIALFFWALYNLEPSLLSVFIEHNVHKHVFGLNVPASSFFAFEGVGIILIGLILGRVWSYLASKNKNPGFPIKFSLGLVIMGAAFLYLIALTHAHGMHSKLGFWPFFAVYLLFATGELLISPIGISMVGRLVPQGSEGLAMGFWQLSTGASAVLTGYLSMLTVVPKHADMVQSFHIYNGLFFKVAMISVAAGLFVLLISPLIKRLI